MKKISIFIILLSFIFICSCSKDNIDNNYLNQEELQLKHNEKVLDFINDSSVKYKSYQNYFRLFRRF